MTFFSDNKNQGMPSINPLLAAMNDKSMLNMMPNFDDPVEQSLASLEQLECKLELLPFYERLLRLLICEMFF